MEDTAGKSCYEGTAVQAYKSFMMRSREHEVIMSHLRQILHQEFDRYVSTKSILKCLKSQINIVLFQGACQDFALQ